MEDLEFLMDPFIFMSNLLCAVAVGWAATFFKRSFLGWALLALLLLPLARMSDGFAALWALTFLLLAGDRQDYDAAATVEETVGRRVLEEALSKERAAEAASAECPHCQAELNLETLEGLKQDEEEPWRLFCEACGNEVSAEGGAPAPVGPEDNDEG